MHEKHARREGTGRTTSNDGDSRIAWTWVAVLAAIMLTLLVTAPERASAAPRAADVAHVWTR